LSRNRKEQGGLLLEGEEDGECGNSLGYNGSECAFIGVLERKGIKPKCWLWRKLIIKGLLNGKSLVMSFYTASLYSLYESYSELTAV